jgi:hypothetical protein
MQSFAGARSVCRIRSLVMAACGTKLITSSMTGSRFDAVSADLVKRRLPSLPYRKRAACGFFILVSPCPPPQRARCWRSCTKSETSPTSEQKNNGSQGFVTLGGTGAEPRPGTNGNRGPGPLPFKPLRSPVSGRSGNRPRAAHGRRRIARLSSSKNAQPTVHPKGADRDLPRSCVRQRSLVGRESGGMPVVLPTDLAPTLSVE